MRQPFRRFGKISSKPLRMGLYGAIGCLLAAWLLGEALLHFTQVPPPPAAQVPPQAIVLVIDCSGSMEGDKLREVKAAATSFVQRQDLSRNQLAIIGFGTNVYLEAPLSGERATLETAIANLADGGNTNMELAIPKAVEQWQSTPLRRNILLFTDGHPNNPAETLASGESVRANQINLVAVATGDADINFLAQLTGDRNLVFSARSGQFSQAFRQAEAAIYGQLLESETSGNYSPIYGILRVGAWTGILALGIALALIVGQNQYLHRRLLTWSDAGLGVVGGLQAGFLAGTLGQLLFVATTGLQLDSFSRLAAWTVLGILVGGGMSTFIPNLKLNRALIGGGIGGIAGASGFLALAGLFHDAIARLVGAALLGFFIGLMVAWIEQIGRQAWLVVHWSPREQTIISLGEQPVILGSSPRAHIYLSRAQGFSPITATICQEGGAIVIQYDQDYGLSKGMKKLKHELQDGEQRKFGQTTITVNIKNS